MKNKMEMLDEMLKTSRLQRKAGILDSDGMTSLLDTWHLPQRLQRELSESASGSWDMKSVSGKHLCCGLL